MCKSYILQHSHMGVSSTLVGFIPCERMLFTICYTKYFFPMLGVYLNNNYRTLTLVIYSYPL
jgi:hypothetical protein